MKRICVLKLARLSLVLAALALAAGGNHASAQDEAIPDSVAADVSAGTTEAAGEAAFMAAPEDEAEAAEEAAEDESELKVDWTLNAGGAINTGNTRSWNVNAGSDVILEKLDHRLTLGALFNFGRADIAPTDDTVPYTTVARQFFFVSRYDYFISEMDAVWAGLSYRWDPLAGFRAQLMANAGYLRAFVKTDKHYFAGRIGYSYTFENYEVPPSTLTSNSNIHGLLAALDYENRLNEHVEFLSSIVTIYNLNKVEVQNALPFQDIRIYFTVALLSHLTDKLAFEARFLMLYDRIPPGPDLVKVDTTTLFSLVYTFM
jgi:putative salt-induced outer membrane protein YdiY